MTTPAARWSRTLDGDFASYVVVRVVVRFIDFRGTLPRLYVALVGGESGNFLALQEIS
jgi:hypothetical protein